MRKGERGNRFPDRTIDSAERDAEAARLRARGLSYAKIAAELGIGVMTAHNRVQRAIQAAAAKGGTEALGTELVKLDAMEAAAWAVLAANHIFVSDGRVVKDDGVAITDHKPVLMAIDRLVRISERRSKLLGLDAPTRQTVTVITEDVVDANIRRLSEELAAHAEASSDV